MKTIAAFLFVLSLIAQNTAMAAPEECDRNQKKIYSVNGIMTSDREALFNLLKLAESYRRLNSEDKVPEFGYLYNPTGMLSNTQLSTLGLPLDLAEVMFQRTRLDLTVIRRTFAKLERARTDLPNYVDDFEGTLTDIANDANVIDPATLMRMKDNVMADIDSGKKVVLVGHSQGNLWVNSLLILPEFNGERRSAVAQVGVAVPASALIRTIEPHLTLTEDRIIQIAGFTLPPNETNGYPPFEFLDRTAGHNFILAYLDKNKPSEFGVNNRINATFEGLQAGSNLPTSCARVQIESVSCRIKNFPAPNPVDSDVPFFVWTYKGSATIDPERIVDYRNLRLSAQISNPGIRDACPTSFPELHAGNLACTVCTDWTGVYADRTCGYAEGDPVSTNWEAVTLHKAEETPPIQSVDAHMFGPNNFDYDFLEMDRFTTDRVDGVSCPGAFTCANGVCQ